MSISCKRRSQQAPFEVRVRTHKYRWLSFIETDEEISRIAVHRGYGIHAEPGSEHGSGQAWKITLVQIIAYTDKRTDVVAVVVLDNSEFTNEDFKLLQSEDFGWTEVLRGYSDDFEVHKSGGLTLAIGPRAPLLPGPFLQRRPSIP